MREKEKVERKRKRESMRMYIKLNRKILKVIMKKEYRKKKYKYNIYIYCSTFYFIVIYILVGLKKFKITTPNEQQIPLKSTFSN